MALAQSSFPIKSWPTRGVHNEKIRGMFHPTPTRAIARSHVSKVTSNSCSPLAFNVRRNEPELISPARPTPNKLKLLSDVDAQDMLLYQQSLIWFYPGVADMKDKDPAEVMKNALGEALVYYYPWAGRIRYQGPFQKLAVDCTAEGVVFVEAEADISLEELAEESLLPPYPYIDQLLYGNAANTLRVFNCPILTMQVTRLSCGGFILALSFNHAMADGVGVVGLLTTISELAGGATAPSILPVWRRNLLNSTNPYHITPNMHHAPILSLHTYNTVFRTFSFTPRHVTTLRSFMPPHLRHCTAFELIAAALWRCRNIALRFDPEQQVSLGFVLSARPKFGSPIPLGFYGNTVTLATAISTAGKICDGNFSYVVEELKKARQVVTGEYKSSLVDPGILRGRRFSYEGQTSCIVSDVSMFRHAPMDFGWGKAVHCGPADNSHIPHILNFIIPYRNENGEDVKAVPVYLPEDAMGRFAMALESLLKEQ